MQDWRPRCFAAMLSLAACSGSSPSPAPVDSGTSDGGTGGDSGDVGPAFAWVEAAPCPLARFEANGAIVDGALWVVGGFVSARLDVTSAVDIYDPATDSWHAGPPLPGAQTHIGLVALGSDVLVVGGFLDSLVSTTADVWRWSGADARWIPGPALPAPQSSFAWALLGNQLHIAGGLAADGQSDTGIHLVWDVTGAGPWIAATSLTNPRNHGGGAAGAGVFYAIAGRHRWDEVGGDDPEVDALDPASGDWTVRAPIPTARSEIAASTSAMADGRILVVGGSVAGKHPSTDVLIYDPALDTWSQLPPLPEARKGAVAARFGPRIVVTTGSPTSTDPSATTWVGCCL
jgi:N-acetylneuraminic acid mutarotase